MALAGDSPMYQSHWGLREAPFRNRLDPRFFFQSPTHEEGLARLHFLLEQRRRLGLLMGEAGSGKSLLLEVFAAQIRQQGAPVARFSLLGLEPAEFLIQLAAQFGGNPEPTCAMPTLWQMVLDRILAYRYQELPTVVLLDDVDRASQAVLLQVTRLAQFDPTPESHLTLVLAGRLARMGRLGERLLELAELRIDLQPWQATDTEAYVNASLARAGRQEPLFEPAAIGRLHELTQGVPRRVNQLADLTLLAGAGRELRQIGADTVSSVYQELGVIEV